jgi:hypothetical protein
MVVCLLCASLWRLAFAEQAPIPVEYRHSAIAAGVPYKVLYAIALAESNNPSDERFSPWPWTLNIAGQPAYLDSKEAAIALLKSELSKGTRNIDICVGQINYQYNAHLLPVIDQALDIDTCLNAATSVLLRELKYCEHQLGRLDWWCAVERYHSPGSSNAQRKRAITYAGRVQRIYRGLSDE